MGVAVDLMFYIAHPSMIWWLWLNAVDINNIRAVALERLNKNKFPFGCKRSYILRAGDATLILCVRDSELEYCARLVVMRVSCCVLRVVCVVCVRCVLCIYLLKRRPKTSIHKHGNIMNCNGTMLPSSGFSFSCFHGDTHPALKVH